MRIRGEWLKSMAMVILAITGSLLSGCEGMKGMLSDREKEPTLCLRQVDISLDSDANMDSATAIDLLVVYRKDLLDAVMKMSARDYFASAMQLKRDYPEMVDIWHWELTPGQVVKDYPIIQRDETPVGAVFFADYLTQGDHRVRFGNAGHAHLRLKKFDFCVLEQGCSSDITHNSITSTPRAQDPQVDAIQAGLKQPSGQAQQDPVKLLKKEEAGMKKEMEGLKKEAKSIEKLFSK